MVLEGCGIINKDRNVYTLTIIEYAVIGHKGFKTKGFKVDYKSKVLNTW